MQALDIQQLIDRHVPGFALERDFYVHPDVLELEFERIFSRRWLFTCPAAAVKHAGDYLLVPLFQESTIVARSHDGVLRGFFNVCRHRGSHICTKPRGKVKSLVCPYYACVYDLDGKLISARLIKKDFDLDSHNLIPVHLREEQGLVFICLAVEPRDDFSPLADAVSGDCAHEDCRRV